MTASRRDPHLGENTAALVDGALDHNARDRALAHVLRCDFCRLEVETQRRLKSQLLDLAPPAVSAGLAERLRNIPERVPARPVAGLPRPGSRPVFDPPPDWAPTHRYPAIGS